MYRETLYEAFFVRPVLHIFMFLVHMSFKIASSLEEGYNEDIEII